MPKFGRNRDNDRKVREARGQTPVGPPYKALTEDSLNYYYRQVEIVHNGGANATFGAIRAHIGGTIYRHLAQLQEGLDTLVERSRLEYKEVDRRSANMTGTEMAYVPITT